MVSIFIDIGIFAIVVMVSLPLLMCRHLCCHQASVITLIACRKAGIHALVVMVLLPLIRRCLCRCCDGDCCSRHNVIIAVIDAQASPPLLSWCYHPCCLSSSWHCCPCHDGAVAVDAQASLLLLPLQLLPS